MMTTKAVKRSEKTVLTLKIVLCILRILLFGRVIEFFDCVVELGIETLVCLIICHRRPCSDSSHVTAPYKLSSSSLSSSSSLLLLLLLLLSTCLCGLQVMRC